MEGYDGRNGRNGGEEIVIVCDGCMLIDVGVNVVVYWFVVLVDVVEEEFVGLKG